MFLKASKNWKVIRSKFFIWSNERTITYLSFYLLIPPFPRLTYTSLGKSIAKTFKLILRIIQNINDFMSSTDNTQEVEFRNIVCLFVCLFFVSFFPVFLSFVSGGAASIQGNVRHIVL